LLSKGKVQVELVCLIRFRPYYNKKLNRKYQQLGIGKVISELSVVLHVCNISYVGGIGRKIVVQVHPKKKSIRSYLKNN
jgi:hypothetical protein